MAAPAAAERARRILVACVGNTLRGDDGFGIAVAAVLPNVLPPGADLIETGIGGLGIVHQLMEGYDGLVIVDAVERTSAPGTVFVLEPQVSDVRTPTFQEWREQLADLHLAEPSRVLRIAQAAGVLPTQVFVVGCRPLTCEDFQERLSRQVAAAVPVAAQRVRELVEELLRGRGTSGCRQATRCAHQTPVLPRADLAPLPDRFRLGIGSLGSEKRSDPSRDGPARHEARDADVPSGDDGELEKR